MSEHFQKDIKGVVEVEERLQQRSSRMAMRRAMFSSTFLDLPIMQMNVN
jgi:hypothetical protein